MKYTCVLCLLTILYQEGAAQPGTLYVFGGPNLNTQTVISAPKHITGGATFGYHIGLGYPVKISGSWFFNPEIELTRKAMKFTGNGILGVDTTGSISTTFDMDYLLLRPGIFYVINKRISISGAFYAAVFMNAYTTDKGKITFQNGTILEFAGSGDEPLPEHPLDYGFNIGTAYKFNDDFSLKLSWEKSLVSREFPGFFATPFKGYTHSVLLSLYYNITGPDVKKE